MAVSKVTPEQISGICSVLRISEHDLRQALCPVPPATEPVKQVTPKCYTREEASLLLGMSIATLDRRIKDSKIPSVKMGRKVLIPAEGLYSLLQISA